MNTLNYIGCKNKLYDTIQRVILNVVPSAEEKTFTDGFAGTGIVGFSIKDKVKSVASNDLEYYSYVINQALLCCIYSSKLEKMIRICNDLVGVEGLLYKNYSPNPTCERMFFTNENAKKADAIRQYIENQYNMEMIVKQEYYFLIASLLTSIDKVANTTSVYGAYLKKFKNSSIKSFVLLPIHKEKNYHLQITWCIIKQSRVYLLQQI